MTGTNRFGELFIQLPSGGTLCCGPSSDGSMFGGDVRIRDKDGNEVVMWASTEWEEAPEEVMGAIFGASTTPMTELLDKLKRTKVEDECWI